MSTPIFWVGLDVHKDSVTAAVFRDRVPEPMRVDRLPNDHRKLRRYFERLASEGSVRACYEASGAGYVLQRAGVALKHRQRGMDPSVVAHAWKCQHRLYKVFHRLAAKKPNQLAATAVARELVGFLWAVLKDLDLSERQYPEVERAA